MVLDVILYALMIFIVMAVLLYGNGSPPSVIEIFCMMCVSVVISWIFCDVVESKTNQPIEKSIGCVEFTIDHVVDLEYRDARVAAKEYYFVKPNEYGIARLEFEQVKPRIIDGKVYASLYLVAKNNTFSHHQEIRDVSCQIR